MSNRPDELDGASTSDALIQLQTLEFDLVSQIEAFGRCARDIQLHLEQLTQKGTTPIHVHALHALRTCASKLKRDCEPFCEMVREVERLTGTLGPERRTQARDVAQDRRRDRY
jgi:hypothetical protein